MQKLSNTKITKIITNVFWIFVVITIGSWLFQINVQNCLARDFREAPGPAICYRAVNDYESTIDIARSITYKLFVVTLILASTTVSLRNIQHSKVSKTQQKQRIIVLALSSLLLLLIIKTVFAIYDQVPYNNNNDVLNSTVRVTNTWMIPLLILTATATIIHGITYARGKD